MNPTSLHGVYIARVDLTQPHLMGVSKKIQCQVAAMRRASVKISLLSVEATQVVRDGRLITNFGLGAWNRRFIHFWRFYNHVSKMNENLDFAYIRYQRTSPAFLKMLHCLRKRNPKISILIEIPSWPYRKEAVSLREKLYGQIDRILSRFLHLYVDRIVTFSDEAQILRIPTIRTDNGTDVFDTPLADRSKDPNRLHILGLANLSFWHGYDRVLKGIYLYKAQGGIRDLRFEVVGTGSELPRLRADAVSLGLSENVCFHGALSGAQLTAVIEQCHIAVSSIGIHRVQNDTSTLKSREYCARGLPFALGHTDRDFTEFPFAFCVPADESPLNIEALIKFFDDLRHRHPNYALKMRRFAEERLTWDVKLKPFFDYLRSASSLPDRKRLK